MNIIFIMCDSLRPDHLGFYGNEWIQTPNLDRLSKESVVFDNAYPEGLPTIPVRTALFTGNYTLTNRYWQPMTPHDVPMAEILDEYKYTNAMITDTYHMFKPNMNFHRGFHVWRLLRGQQDDPYRSGAGRLGKEEINKYIKNEMRNTTGIRSLYQYLQNIKDRRDNNQEEYFTARVFSEAIEWLKHDSKTGHPFFLYVDCFDPHEPWDPPDEFLSKYADPNYSGPKLIMPNIGPADWLTHDEVKYIRALYAGEVSFVDKWIGKLMDQIDAMGLKDDSLIIFMSDHGEPLGEHGIFRKTTDSLYSELVRIALMFRFPKAEYGDQRVNSLVSVVDIFPTILDILGYRHELEYVQGKSVLPLISGTSEKIHEYATMGFFEAEDRCVRDGELSYIRRPAGRKDELYNYVEDPKETSNLIDQYPQKAKEMEMVISRISECRMQKETWVQLNYDIPPEICEKRFPPNRVWKK